MSQKGKKQRGQGGRKKQIRAGAKSDAGTCARVMAEAEQLYPSDPRAQAAHFMEHALLPAAIGRRRILSAKRYTEFGNTLQLCITELQEMRRPLASLADLKRKVILALVRRWVKAGLSEGTIHDRISILRRFTTLIGKAGTLPRGRQWQQVLEQQGIKLAPRRGIAELKKGWMDMGIDPWPIIEAVRAEEEICGSNMELMLVLGARLNESVQDQPKDSDKGDYFLLLRGTKGRKTRSVPYSTDPERRALQMEVLQRAKLLAAKHPKGLLAIPGLSLKQMKDRLEYVVAKHGVSKAGLGITLHGLRHQYATDLFRELTGMPAPVLKLLPKEEYDANREKVRAAYLEIARRMGHERPSISGAYLSTPSQLGRDQRQQLRKWEHALQPRAAAFEAAGAEEGWIVGRCADGLLPRDGEAMQIAVRMLDAGQTLSVVAESLEALRKSLSETLGDHLVVFAWTLGQRPPEGFEVFLRSPGA